MNLGEGSRGKKEERKNVEKKRRILMKVLCFKLVSLIPDNYVTQPKVLLPQQDQVDHSIAYIEFLRERVEELRRRKAQLMNTVTGTINNMVESKQPVLTVKELGSNVEVVIISGLNKKFRLHDVIRIIEQEAAQVLSLSISTVDAKIIHSIHAQVKFSRIGVDTARISGRIYELISTTL